MKTVLSVSLMLLRNETAPQYRTFEFFALRLEQCTAPNCNLGFSLLQVFPFELLGAEVKGHNTLQRIARITVTNVG